MKIHHLLAVLLLLSPLLAQIDTGAGGGGGGSGTVTSVAQTVPSGFAIAGSPVTTAGTLAITYTSAADQLLLSTASNTAGFATLPTCSAATSALTYNVTTHAFGCNAIGAPALETVGDPGANKSFTMSTRTLNFNFTGNWGAGFGYSITSNGSNASTGPLLQLSSGSGTTHDVFQACALGTSNCVKLTSAGLFTTIGTAAIDATKLNATGTPSSTTFLRGDNTWNTPAGAGTVTSVGFTGGLISVGTPTSTPAFTVAGTSGGIPYFSAASTWASSGALASGQFVLGGGAGSTPTTSFSVVPIANGGTGTASTLTGLMRGSATAMTAAELSGDLTTSGSNAATLATVNANVGSFTAANITVNAKGLVTAAANGSGGGSGTVTNTGGNLTSNAVVLGAGTTDTKVSTGITTNGVAELDIGVSGTSGVLGLKGSTSGTSTFTAPAVAGTSTNPVTASNILILPTGSVSAPALSLGQTGAGVYGLSTDFWAWATGGNVTSAFNITASIWEVSNGGGMIFNSTSNLGGGSFDLGLFRAASKVMEVADGSTANSNGGLKASYFASGGTKFTASGCTNGTTVGGATAGSLLTGASGACTLTVTMGNSDTATNGWSCWASDQTTAAGNPIYQNGGSTTTATLALPVGNVSGDKISFGCMAY